MWNCLHSQKCPYPSSPSFLLPLWDPSLTLFPASPSPSKYWFSFWMTRLALFFGWGGIKVLFFLHRGCLHNHSSIICWKDSVKLHWRLCYKLIECVCRLISGLSVMFPWSFFYSVSTPHCLNDCNLIWYVLKSGRVTPSPLFLYRISCQF